MSDRFGIEHGRPAVDGCLHCVAARQVRGDYGEIVFEGECHIRPIEFPIPAGVALGLCDQVIGVPRPFPPGAIDVALVLAVELLERDGRASPRNEQLPQSRDTQRVLGGVVVNLTEQHDAMAFHRVRQCTGSWIDLHRRCRRPGSSEEPEQAGGDSHSEAGSTHRRSLRGSAYRARSADSARWCANKRARREWASDHRRMNR